MKNQYRIRGIHHIITKVSQIIPCVMSHCNFSWKPVHLFSCDVANSQGFPCTQRNRNPVSKGWNLPPPTPIPKFFRSFIVPSPTYSEMFMKIRFLIVLLTDRQKTNIKRWRYNHLCSAEVMIFFIFCNQCFGDKNDVFLICYTLITGQFFQLCSHQWSSTWKWHCIFDNLFEAINQNCIPVPHAGITVLEGVFIAAYLSQVM